MGSGVWTTAWRFVTRKPRSTAKATVAIPRQIFQLSWPLMLAQLSPPLGANIGGRISFPSVIPPDLVATSQICLKYVEYKFCSCLTIFLSWSLQNPKKKMPLCKLMDVFLTLARPWMEVAAGAGGGGAAFWLVSNSSLGFWHLYVSPSWVNHCLSCRMLPCIESAQKS